MNRWMMMGLMALSLVAWGADGHAGRLSRDVPAHSGAPGSSDADATARPPGAEVRAGSACKGKLRVTAIPRARVAIDGVGFGISPTPPITLPAGRYELVLSHRLLGEHKRIVHVTCRGNQHLQLRW